MTIVCDNIANVSIATTTDFRGCSAGKRSAEITIKTAGGRSHSFDNVNIPPIGLMGLFSDNKMIGTCAFGKAGEMIINGDQLVLELEDHSLPTISIPLASGSNNLRYVQEIMRAANWCSIPLPSQDPRIGTFIRKHDSYDLAITTTYNEIHDLASEQSQAVPNAEVPSEPIEKPSIYAEARNQSKAVISRAALEYGKEMIREYQGLLEMVDMNVEDKMASETILHVAIAFADNYCPNEASKLRALQEEHSAICDKVEQQIKSLSFA